MKESGPNTVKKTRVTRVARHAIVVMVTAASEREATTIGRQVVEMGLAACANVLPRMTSIFRWEGKVAQEQEFLILIKTQAQLFERLAAAVQRLHSYQVPEIIAISITAGSVRYLEWLKDSAHN